MEQNNLQATDFITVITQLSEENVQLRLALAVAERKINELTKEATDDENS